MKAWRTPAGQRGAAICAIGVGHLPAQFLEAHVARLAVSGKERLERRPPQELVQPHLHISTQSTEIRRSFLHPDPL